LVEEAEDQHARDGNGPGGFDGTRHFDGLGQVGEHEVVRRDGMSGTLDPEVVSGACGLQEELRLLTDFADCIWRQRRELVASGV